MLSSSILLFLHFSDLHVNVISVLSNSSREASHLKNLHLQSLQIAQAEHSFWRSIGVTPDREKKFAEPAQPSAPSEYTTAPSDSTGSNHHPCSESLRELAQ